MPEPRKPEPARRIVSKPYMRQAQSVADLDVLDTLVTISQQLDYLIDLVAGIERGQ